MTESDWLASADPTAMLQALRNKASERKLRLFCCAGARLLPPLEDPTDAAERARAVDVAERFADGLASAEELAAAAVCSQGEGFWAVAHPDAFDAAESSAHDEHLEGRQAELADLLRDLFGDFFRPVALDPAWLTDDVRALAAAAYAARRLPEGALEGARLAVLADALEEAGCTSRELLDHLRFAGRHVRGCWAVDLALGRGR